MKYTELLIYLIRSRISITGIGKNSGRFRSIVKQELLCRGWFLPPNTYDCGSFVVNGTAVVGKEPKKAL
ncbi:Uncharacterised protein [uncultured Clostridium sp.]|nr:Uncharacterised protein [uncultured Clostridium sp.]